MTSNIIKFIHEDRIIEVRNPDPNETLLNFVRTELRKTGTKEGCAEGGCGACTVVLGELKDDQMLVTGATSPTPCTIDSHNDHRIAMAGGTMNAICQTGTIHINNKEAVNKSYPEFFEEMDKFSWL